MRRALIAAAVLAAVAPAHAEDAPAPAPPLGPSTLRRIAAVGAAIVPGVVVHGSGGWVIGERRAARRLFTTSLVGLGAMAVGGLAIGVSGGSEYLIVPATPVLLAGSALFLQGWLADVWVAAGGERIHTLPHAPPPWSLEAGTTWVHDPYRDRALVRTAGRLAIGRFGVGVASLVDAGGEARTGELALRWRLLGAAATGETLADGSWLAVGASGRVHRDDTDAVTLTTGEVEVLGRLDLAHLHAALAGSFAELSTGLGLERARYATGVHDLGTLLLGRFGWGLYLGTRSEASVFYDHRRDSLAGGFAAGRAAGFVGSFGAAAELRIAGPWAVCAELEVGNAWVSTLALRYHGGPR